QAALVRIPKAPWPMNSSPQATRSSQCGVAPEASPAASPPGVAGVRAGAAAETGAAPGSLRLYDDRGRVLDVTGLTAGSTGEGPRGTLWILRAAGLPEASRGPGAPTDPERTVAGERAFRWPPDPGPPGR